MVVSSRLFFSFGFDGGRGRGFRLTLNSVLGFEAWSSYTVYEFQYWRREFLDDGCTSENKRRSKYRRYFCSSLLVEWIIVLSWCNSSHRDALALGNLFFQDKVGLTDDDQKNVSSSRVAAHFLRRHGENYGVGKACILESRYNQVDSGWVLGPKIKTKNSISGMRRWSWNAISSGWKMVLLPVNIP